MKIKELCEILGLRETLDYSDLTGRFIAGLRPHVDLKGEGVISSILGSGKTKAAAKRDLACSLAGKRLVLDAYGPGRREFQIPKTLKA